MNIYKIISTKIIQHAHYFFIGIAISGAIYFAYFSYRYGIMLSNMPKPYFTEPFREITHRILISRKVYFALSLIFMLLLIMVIYERHARIKTKNIVDRLEWTINRLSAVESAKSEIKEADPVSKWPWGSHHTDALGNLEAAATRFWKLYDPADQSTAPTNEMVAEWLRDERSVSKEKAYAIASILRADGLKTGPRR